MKQFFKLLLLRCILNMVGLISPQLAGKFAGRIFTTPSRVPSPPREQNYLRMAEKITLKSGYQGYVWGKTNTKGNILLVHGWSGRGSQMGMFGEALSKCGYKVYAFDGPAHGLSPYTTTDPHRFAEFLIVAAEEVGGLEGIVAHSFGAGSSVLALTLGLKIKKLVYIAGPYYYNAILTGFAKLMHLSPRVKNAFYRQMEKLVGVPIDAMVIGKLIQGQKVKGLIIQDEEDNIIPISAAKQLHHDWKSSELYVTHGLGHIKILHDPAVAEKVCEFFAEE